MLNLNPTTANFPGYTYLKAVSMAYHMKSDWANIQTEHMQLCPQQIGVVDSQVCDKLIKRYSQTQFRCHANVRLFENLHIFDATSDQELEINKEYIKKLKDVSSHLGAKIYSFHAGRRTISLNKMADNIKRLQDKLQIMVAVEGLYPDKNAQWLINSWSEYEWLLNSKLCMAIDVSHLQIVANAEKVWPTKLISELLSSPNCLEIHVAGNDEVHDNHQKVKGNEKWHSVLENIKTNAIIFTEENQRIKKLR